MTEISSGTFQTPTASSREQYESIGSSNAYAANQLSGSIDDATKSYIKYKTDQQNQMAGAAVDSASGSILTGVSEYDKRLRHISEAMMSASPEQAQQLQDEVQRIKDGQVQGLISPSAAILQYHNIAKSYSNNPAIASAARQYIGTFTGELGAITKADDEQTSVEKGHAKLAEEAAANLRSPLEELQARQQKEALAKASSDYALSVQNGKSLGSPAMYAYTHAADVNSPRNKLLDAAQPAIATEALAGYIKQLAHGMPKEKVLQAMALERSHVVEGFRTVLDAIHNDPAGHGFTGPGGVVFEADETEKMLAAIGKPYDDMKDIIEKTDRTDMVKRLADANLDIKLKHGANTMLDNFGYLGYTFITNATDGAKALHDLNQIGTDYAHGMKGTWDALEKYAPGSSFPLRATYGKDSKEMLGNMALSIGQLIESPKAPKVTDQRADAAAPPELQAPVDKAFFGIVSSEPDVNKKIKMAANFLNNFRPLDGFVANMTDMTPLIQMSKPLRDTIDARFAASLGYVVKQLGAAGAGKVKFDPVAGRFKVDPSVHIEAPSDVYGGSGKLGALGNSRVQGPTPGAANKSAIAMKSNDAENYLNKMMTLRGAYPGSKEENNKWVVDGFNGLMAQQGEEAERDAAAYRAAGVTGTFHLMTNDKGVEVLGKNGKAIDPNTPIGKQDAINIAQLWEANGDNEKAIKVYHELNKNGAFNAKIKELTAKVEPVT